MFKLADRLSRKMSPATLAWLVRKSPLPVLRYIAIRRFRQTIRLVERYSPFYRRAFAERGIDTRLVKTPGDLGDFYTTPEDIVASPTDFICQKPSIVFESSGTSGKNKQVYYTDQEMRENGLVGAIGFFLLGLDLTDRVANAFDFSIWIPGMISHYSLMASGIFSLAFGKVDPLEVYRRLGEYRFTAVFGEPTWLIRLTELAEQKGPWPLKMLLGGAEEMPPGAIAWMERIWAPAKVKMCYGSVELGSALGFQPCDHIDGYHMDIMNYLPEVIAPDQSGYGELVITTLCRRTMPLIRYRTRDIVKLYPQECLCGLPLPRMSKLRGRCDEMVVAAGGNLNPLMFENILRPIMDRACNWQVIFKLDGVREIMEIHLESARQDKEAIEVQLRQQIGQQYPDLMKNLALGIFEMRLLLRPPASLRSGRKLNRLIDRRYVPQAEESSENSLDEQNEN
jgi:phenylacetate-CoA ligase